MGYRDDFYMVQNIVGYTGDIHDFPTVYFETATEYGHITQRHGSSQNVGRGKVKAIGGHTMQNEDVNGAMHLVERQNGKVTHTSRGVLTRIDTFDPAQRDNVALLAQAIYGRDDGEKYISSFNKEIRADIKATKDAKALVNAEILSRGAH